ncbi:hypothetical protein RJ639_032360 [Escallonia herrerae]|uniref:Uncharacterized protein n=1 Tax=Escallonia herrerae TaxID=1293975 RepID=A0AA89BB33_9ASTE|nr:hypothetical protein RJ639_032360 [Escallonia herrerae]
MSSAMRASPPTLPLHTTRSGASRHVWNSSLMFPLASHPVSYSKSIRIEALTNFSEGGPVPGLESAPVSVELEPVPSESQFDRVIAEAQQLEESVDGKLVQEMYISETKVGKIGG